MKGTAAVSIAVLAFGAFRAVHRERPNDRPLARGALPAGAAWPDVPASFPLPFSSASPVEPLAVAGSVLGSPPPNESPPGDERLPSDAEHAMVERARREVEREVRYDAGYWYLRVGAISMQDYQLAQAELRRQPRKRRPPRRRSGAPR